MSQRTCFALLSTRSLHSFSRVIDFGWLAKPEMITSELIVYIVTEVQKGNDLRDIDLHTCEEVVSEELEVMADYCRDMLLRLRLEGCRIGVQDSTIARIGSCCRHLVSLNLNGCMDLTDKAFDSIGKELLRLESLSCSNVKQLTDEGITDFCRKCTLLKHVNLDRVQRLTDDGMTAIGESLKQLEELSIAHCLAVTDRGLYTFSQYTNSELSGLNLMGCRKITDDGVAAMAEKLTALKSLSLKFCNKVSDRGALAVSHNCLQLENLDFTDLYQVTDRALHFDKEGDGRPCC